MQGHQRAAQPCYAHLGRAGDIVAQRALGRLRLRLAAQLLQLLPLLLALLLLPLYAPLVVEVAHVPAHPVAAHPGRSCCGLTSGVERPGVAGKGPVEPLARLVHGSSLVQAGGAVLGDEGRAWKPRREQFK